MWWTDSVAYRRVLLLVIEQLAMLYLQFFICFVVALLPCL
jgi:hypothetical protein